MKFWLFDVWSKVENGTETAHLIGFDDNNEIIELVDDSILPFLLCEEANNIPFQKLTSLGASFEEVIKVNELEEQKFYKIYGHDATMDIPKFRTILERAEGKTSEADIYYTQVYLKERGLSPCTWHDIEGAEEITRNSEIRLFDIRDADIQKIEDDYTVPGISALALDIEVHNPHGAHLEVETDYIILFGLLFSEGKDKEKLLAMIPTKGKYDDVLIEDAFSKINAFRPTFTVTYNGNEFDWEYIMERYKINGLKGTVSLDYSRPHKTEWSTIAVNGRPTIDLYGVAKFVMPRGSRKTQPIVHAELKRAGLVPKTQFYEINRDMIAKLWDNPKTREEVIKHCESDVRLSMDIFEYAWPFIVELSRLTNLPPDEVLSAPYQVLVEGFMMKIAHELNIVIPNAEPREQPKTSGAVCMEPKKGLIENAAVIDFIGMYPNILIENNISHETYVEDIAVDSNVFEKSELNEIVTDTGERFYFLKEPAGLFKISMERLQQKVEEAKIRYKDKKYKQKYAGEVQALKTVARSMYGYLKAPKSRWYLVEAQEAVASEGRNRAIKAIEAAENASSEIEAIYCDTDSAFLTGIPREDCEAFADWLSDALGYKVGFDKFYPLIFFTEAKKIYAGITEDGEIDTAGFTKSDWAPISNRAQMKILEIILKERDIKKAQDYVENVKKAMKAGMYPLKDFIIWKKLRRPLHTYKQNSCHVIVARRDPEKFVEEDQTVGYVVVPGKKKQKLYERAKHWTEVKGVGDLDMKYYVNKQLLAVSNRILEYFTGEKNCGENYYTF
jgi:DNA polymerase I